MTVFDTGGPQGPPPTSSAPCTSSSGWRNTPEGSEGGGAGLNLDRLAHDAELRAEWVRAWWSNNAWLGKNGAVPEVRNLCDDVLALVERVKTLEAVAEAAREYVSDIDEEGVASDDAIRAALAAAGGGAHE